MASPPDPLAAARLNVDLDALAANYHTLKALAGDAEVAPVVKAGGYGLGAEAIAARLWAEGARSFFTARVAAGEALRAALGPGRPATIHVLDGCPDGAAERLAAADLVPALNTLADVERWGAAAAGAGRRLKASLHLDTGLNRLGLSPEEAEGLAASNTALAGIEVGLMFSHLSCGAEPGHPLNERQRTRFAALAARFPDARASLAASGGIFLGDAYRFDVVRPGVALYGAGPTGRPDPRLKTVAVLRARILGLRDVPAGESVGYGAAWTAQRPTRLGIIGAGYADGLLRSCFPGGSVWFDGALRPFVGALSMDLAAIDVTGSTAARAGEWVELFGKNLPLEDAARGAGTTAYELLTSLGPRTPKTYEGGA